MTKPDFKSWFSTMINQEDDYYPFNYFVDFRKVYEELEGNISLQVSFSVLDNLRGKTKENIEQVFFSLLDERKEIKRCLPLLIASKFKNDRVNLMNEVNSQIIHYDFNDLDSIDKKKLSLFMKDTGLYDLYSYHLKSSTYDYVLGALVGLSTNGRKNRSGKEMEDRIITQLKVLDLKENVDYYYQLSKDKFKQKFNFEIPTTNERRPDFILYNHQTNQIYIVEVNYYHANGSKLSKVCSEYIELNNQITALRNNCHFIWITDGPGWEKEEKSLKEAYYNIKYLLNLNDLKDGKLAKIFHQNN